MTLARRIARSRTRDTKLALKSERRAHRLIGVSMRKGDAQSAAQAFRDAPRRYQAVFWLCRHLACLVDHSRPPRTGLDASSKAVP